MTKRRATIDAGAFCSVCNTWSSRTVFLTTWPVITGKSDLWLCMACVRHITKAGQAPGPAPGNASREGS